MKNIEYRIMKKGGINVYKTIGTRYLKVTYKEFPDEVLIISVVDKS